MKSFLLFLSFIVYQFTSLFLACLLSGVSPGAGSPSPVMMARASLICVPILVVLLAACRLVRGIPFVSLPKTSGNKRPFLTAAALSGFLLLGIGLSLFVSPFELSDGGTGQVFLAMSGYPAGLLLLVFFGPLVEEYVFREGIQRQLTSRFHTVPAALVSAALFGVIHGNLHQGIPAFVLGVALGLLYATTGDMRLNLPAHVLNNAVAFILLLHPEIEGSLTVLPVPLLLVLAVLLIVCGAGLVFWVYFRRSVFRL